MKKEYIILSCFLDSSLFTNSKETMNLLKKYAVQMNNILETKHLVFKIYRKNVTREELGIVIYEILSKEYFITPYNDR